jgi:chromosome segregation ATPase
MITGLVDENDRFREEGARSRSAPVIADLEARLKTSNDRVADLEARLKASEDRNAEAEAIVAQAKTYADAHIARYTSDLEVRNAQMVETVAETVEKLKRDAAARVAAAESNAQDCIYDARDEANSQIRQLSQDLDRHVDMLGLARTLFQSFQPLIELNMYAGKHTGWAAHKLILLLIELKKRSAFPTKTF